MRRWYTNVKQTVISIALLLSTVLANAGTLDSKSLYIGIGIGAGSFVTRNYVALPVTRATKKAAKKTAHTVKKLIAPK